MSIGTVKCFSPVRGYGLIVPDCGGDDVLVRMAAVETAGLSTLADQQRIRFDLTWDQSGSSSASNLKLLFDKNPVAKSFSSKAMSAWDGVLNALQVSVLIVALVFGICGVFATIGDYHWGESVLFFTLCAAALGVRNAIQTWFRVSESSK